MPATRSRAEGAAEGAAEGKIFQEDNSAKYMRTQAMLGVPPAADDGPDDARTYNLYRRGFSSQLVALRRRLDNVRRAGREVAAAEGWRLGARDDGGGGGGGGGGSTSAFVERQLARAGAAIAEAGALDKRNKARYYSEGQQRVAYAEDAMAVAWSRICEFLGVEVPEEGEPLWGRRADRLIDASRQAAKAAKNGDKKE